MFSPEKEILLLTKWLNFKSLHTLKTPTFTLCVNSVNMSKMIKTSRFGFFFLLKKALSWPRKVVYKFTAHPYNAKIILLGWNISPVYGKEKGKYSPDKGWIYEYNN